MIDIRTACTLADAAAGRILKIRADLRWRRSRTNDPSDALSVFGAIDRSARSDLVTWNARTAAQHEAYRAAVPPAAGRVAIVCSSNRPSDLANVVEMVGRQRVAEAELIFVAHGDEFDPSIAEAALEPLRANMVRLQVLHRPTSSTLGDCLNDAMSVTDARFIAKFDSDDRYGPEYLSDSLRAHNFAGAALVGKHSYYVYLARTDEHLLRYPGNEFQTTTTLAGSTFVIDRDVVDDQRFESVSLGEDRAFIRACHRRGLTVFAADRFNHALVRTGENTWNLSRKAVVASSASIAGPDEVAGIDR